MTIIHDFDYPKPYGKASADNLMSVLGFEQDSKGADPEQDLIVSPIITRIHNYLLGEQTMEVPGTGDKGLKLHFRGMSHIEPRYRFDLLLSPYKHQKMTVFSEALVFGVPDDVETFCEAYNTLGGNAAKSTADANAAGQPAPMTHLLEPGKNNRGVDVVLRRIMNHGKLDEILNERISDDEKRFRPGGFIEYLLDRPNKPLVIDLIDEEMLKYAIISACKHYATPAEQRLVGTTPEGARYDIPVTRINHIMDGSWTHYLIPYSESYERRRPLLDALGLALRENLANRHIQTESAKSDLEDWEAGDKAEAKLFLENNRRELEASARRKQKPKRGVTSMIETAKIDLVTGEIVEPESKKASSCQTTMIEPATLDATSRLTPAPAVRPASKNTRHMKKFE